MAYFSYSINLIPFLSTFLRISSHISTLQPKPTFANSSAKKNKPIFSTTFYPSPSWPISISHPQIDPFICPFTPVKHTSNIKTHSLLKSAQLTLITIYIYKNKTNPSLIAYKGNSHILKVLHMFYKSSKEP